MFTESLVADGPGDELTFANDAGGPAEWDGERIGVVCHHDGVCGDVFSWWWHQVEQFPLLSPQREVELAARVRQGDEAAFEEMVECNLRLVVSLAKRCYHYAGPSLAITDLVQEGTIGLIKAVRKFDHRRGYKFSTYASYWIRQAVMRAIKDTGRFIRLPVHASETIYRVEQARLALTNSYQRTPSNPELAQYLSVSLERLQQIFERANDPAALECDLGEGGETSTLEDVLADVEVLGPHDRALDSVARAEVCYTLRRALCGLPEREVRVIVLRYGLDGGPSLTLSEIAGQMSVSRERVRQIENSALRHLRAFEPLREAVLEEDD